MKKQNETMFNELFNELNDNEKKAFKKLNGQLQNGIMNCKLNNVDELKKCIKFKYYKNKIAEYVYIEYRYKIVNEKNMRELEKTINESIAGMISICKNKKELSHTTKGNYGPNALKNCISKNVHIDNNEKALLYQYVDDVTT